MKKWKAQKTCAALGKDLTASHQRSGAGAEGQAAYAGGRQGELGEVRQAGGRALLT